MIRNFKMHISAPGQEASLWKYMRPEMDKVFSAEQRSQASPIQVSSVAGNEVLSKTFCYRWPAKARMTCCNFVAQVL